MCKVSILICMISRLMSVWQGKHKRTVYFVEESGILAVKLALSEQIHT